MTGYINIELMKSNTSLKSKENPKVTLVYIDEDGENEISFDSQEEAQQWLASS